VGPDRLALNDALHGSQVGVRVTERYKMLGQVRHYRLSVSVFGRK